MLYESMKPWVVYNGQNTLMLPKKGPVEKQDSRGNTTEQRAGYGNAIFLITPNISSSIGLLDKESPIQYSACMYRTFTADGRYNAKIGKKKIIKNDISRMKKAYTESNRISLRYLPETSRKAILAQKKNVIVDLGRWMELYFTFTLTNSPKIICERFAKFMTARLGDDEYDGYRKTLLIDISQWTSGGKQCIVMNKRLLNNPLAILIYTLRKYPELMYPYKDMDLYLISRDGKACQALRIAMSDMTTDNFAKIKSKISLFKGVTISADEEETEITVEEIKAEQVITAKKQVCRKLRKGLLGESEPEQPTLFGNAEMEDIFDITEEIQDIDAVDDDLSTVDEDLEQDIVDEIDAFMNENPSAVDSMSTDDMVAQIKPRVARRVASRFMPERTDAEIAKIERLTEGQESVIRKVDLKDAKTKTIDTTDFSGFVETTNPNIKSSKFVNFDQNYVEKKLEDDIDNAVAVLSKTDYPIFITGKEVLDTSDVLNLKQTRVYHLEDAKGNKSTLKFDVPVVIDGKYIFINGSKKIIGHQFVLKPLVKTEPDTVQLVSWYNKVFIRRTGQEDVTTNKIRVYLQKNAEKFQVRSGASIMKNRDYETPLDFDAMSKFFYSFQIGNLLFITEIPALLEQFNKMHPAVKETFDFNRNLPVAINLDTKSLVSIPLGSSYTEFLLDCFEEADRKAVEKIKRKPRLFTATCKMMAREFPLILFMCYCVGFKDVANRVNMEYVFIPKEEKAKLKEYNSLQYSITELEDSYLVWKSTNDTAAILFNGLAKEPIDTFTAADLEDKDTWRFLINRYTSSGSLDSALDNYKDFLMDPASQEILSDFGLPTDLIDLLIVAARMLTDGKYKIESDMSNMRVRSSEVIANVVYLEVTNAYKNYRKTAYKKKPTPIRFKQSAVIQKLLDGQTTNLVEEASSLNPVLELEKGRVVTYKGLRGIQMDRALTLPRRGYNESMLGVVGISTDPGPNVGVIHQLTLEPSITSTRGYINPGSKKDVDKLVSTNLFTPAEMLTPLGVQHDDPDRTSIDCLYLMSTLNLVNCWELLLGYRYSIE